MVSRKLLAIFVKSNLGVKKTKTNQVGQWPNKIVHVKALTPLLNVLFTCTSIEITAQVEM